MQSLHNKKKPIGYELEVYFRSCFISELYLQILNIQEEI